MNSDFVQVLRITENISKKPKDGLLYVCWFQNDIKGIEIDGKVHQNVSNSISFLNRNHQWRIIKDDGRSSAGYILAMHPDVLNNPVLNNLHINELRLFSTNEIPIINLSPGIATRTQSILEMIDELLGSELNHKEEAIISLLNTFFVYCDGQCNIKSVITENKPKNSIVYKFKKLVDKHLTKLHDVAEYAEILNITPKYLNECVKEVLGFTAKGIIKEQLIMRSRYKLKFTDLTVKEISYSLGFSSPEYFSSFFKNQTGVSPSSLRKTA